MKKHTRFLAVLLALAVAFVMLSSAVYISANADHDCIGEGCQICYNISGCENTLKNLSTAVSVIAVAVMLIDCLCMMIDHPAKTVSVCTLVTLKVKLSN